MKTNYECILILNIFYPYTILKAISNRISLCVTKFCPCSGTTSGTSSNSAAIEITDHREGNKIQRTGHRYIRTKLEKCIGVLGCWMQPLANWTVQHNCLINNSKFTYFLLPILQITNNSHTQCIWNKLVRPSGRGTVHSRPHKIFLHFHDLSTLLNNIREGVALSSLSILHKTHWYAN